MVKTKRYLVNLRKDEIGGKIMTKFVAFRAKAYSFTEREREGERDRDRDRQTETETDRERDRQTEILFNNYLDSLFKNKVLYRSQQRVRSDHHKVYKEEVNKTALSSNDDKRIQTFDRVTTYSYGTDVFKVCQNEMLLKKKSNA